MELHVQDGVTDWVRARGGRLFVYMEMRLCCKPLVTLATSVEPPRGGDYAFRRVEWEGGFELWLDPSRRGIEPDSLALELNRRRTRVEAFWNDLAWVD